MSAPDRVGADFGETPRRVTGDPVTEAQADEFAKALGIEPEEASR